MASELQNLTTDEDVTLAKKTEAVAKWVTSRTS
jgi:hypothetical protein